MVGDSVDADRSALGPSSLLPCWVTLDDPPLLLWPLVYEIGENAPCVCTDRAQVGSQDMLAERIK